MDKPVETNVVDPKAVPKVPEVVIENVNKTEEGEFDPEEFVNGFAPPRRLPRA